MKTINVVSGPQNASAVILGCMRMPALTVEKAPEMIRAARRGGDPLRRRVPADRPEAGGCVHPEQVRPAL